MAIKWEPPDMDVADLHRNMHINININMHTNTYINMHT